MDLKIKTMKRIITLLFIVTTLALSAQTTSNAYDIIYSADKDGNAVNGKIENLIEHVKSGNPIRVGWTLKFPHPVTGKPTEMLHWADAGFITILDGHVFAQIKPIYEQGPGFETPPSVYLTQNKPNGWVAIIGTTGMVRQKFDVESLRQSLKESGMSNEEIEKILKQQETMNVPTMWAVMTK